MILLFEEGSDKIVDQVKKEMVKFENLTCLYSTQNILGVHSCIL